MLAAACGSGGSSAGTIKGQAFSPQEASSGNVSLGGSDTGAAILVANTTGICADLAASKQPKNLQALLLILFDVSASTGAKSAPAAPGTYTVSTGTQAKSAIVLYSVTDATCKEITAQGATGVSGTVTLTSASNGSYSGTYAVTFDSSDRLSSSFTAASCSSIDVLFGSGTPTCF